MNDQGTAQRPPPLIDANTNTPSSRESSLLALPLKRQASFEGCDEDVSRKRIKSESQPISEDTGKSDAIITSVNPNLVDDLAQELQCGCCTELVYRPVIVHPCQHFFCGSCCVLWIRNNGTNCPACRSLSTSVLPFRAIQSVIDSLLRVAPHKARTERECQQADEIYKFGHTLRIPPPRESSPEANLDISEFVRPCPHCIAGNPYGWRCPQPIPNPDNDPEHAWHVDDGTPPGHKYCGHCECLLAIQAPTTTKCDFCQIYFCGINVPDRCAAASLLSQQPGGLTDINGIITSSDVYDSFDSNSVEVEFMLDYLRDRLTTPQKIYTDIIERILSQPGGFKPLMEEVFIDMQGISTTNWDSNAPRHNICRHCAFEVLLWGIKEWWVRERQKGDLASAIMNRQDCPDGRNCKKQTELAHARSFNHIFPREEPLSEHQQNLQTTEPERQTATAAAPLANVPSMISTDGPLEPPSALGPEMLQAEPQELQTSSNDWV